jgi:7-carboxy-7-deazaguanine synthase
MSYAVHSMFDTLQGEGTRAGTRNVFVRLAGCNMWSGRAEDRDKGAGACARWCDTDFFKGEKMSAMGIRDRMSGLWPRPKEGRFYDGNPIKPTRAVVITGGEPALQLDLELLRTLNEDGWFVAVETNGSIRTAAIVNADWITCSPKKGGAVELSDCDEVKVVLPGAGGDHGPWTDEELGQLMTRIKARFYYVQPQDAIVPAFVDTSYLKGIGPGGEGHPGSPLERAYKEHLARCISFVREHPRWKLSVQTHKMVGLP